MQMLLLSLVILLFAHDALDEPWITQPTPLSLLVGGILPFALLAAAELAACWRVRRLLKRASAALVLKRLGRFTMTLRLLLIGCFAASLHLGLLVGIRQVMGDWLLVDELIALALPMSVILWGWWVYYPIDRRLREATLISRADAGRPIYPLLSRGQFLLNQVRHQVALILVPVLLIRAWYELAAWLGPDGYGTLSETGTVVMGLVGAAAVFLTAPLMIRVLFDTVPLAPGELRERLVGMCQQYGVGVRELLLWRTFGGTINAAVMGFAGPLRYILLSDGLLDQLRWPQVEAVMAHELGHVRCRHMFWLVAAAGASLGLMETVITLGLLALLPSGAMEAGQPLDLMLPNGAIVPITADTVAVAAMVVSLVGWFFVFGWVSRRIERQADAFAVRHLAEAREDLPTDSRGTPLVDSYSAETMISALAAVAELNNVPPGRRSWRHGSIAWRQAYLRSLIGKPVDDLPIDRLMRRVNLASLAAIAVVVLANTL